MKEWWLGLALFQRFYFIVAVLGTIALIVDAVMMAVGLKKGKFVKDGETDVDGAGGWSVFTTRGLSAFFTVGGWVGMLIYTEKRHVAAAVFGSLAAGTVALIGVGFLLRAVYRTVHRRRAQQKQAEEGQKPDNAEEKDE